MSKMTIATHSGVFHADDVFAVAALQLCFPEAEVIRTRDEESMAQATIRVDVGGKYNIFSGDYDHHQAGGAGERPNGIPYAAFGLVWIAFGEKIAGSEAIGKKVDEYLVQQVDAGDARMKLWEPAIEGIDPMNITGIISSFNPTWQEGADFDAAFMQALEVAKLILARAIARAKAEVEAEEAVREAITGASEAGKLIILEGFMPWQKVVVEEAPEALYVVYQSQGWKVQAVPMDINSREQRKPLPKSWRGKNAAELAEITGVEDAIFAHPGGFICGASSREGALRLAQLAIQNVSTEE